MKNKKTMEKCDYCGACRIFNYNVEKPTIISEHRRKWHGAYKIIRTTRRFCPSCKKKYENGEFEV